MKSLWQWWREWGEQRRAVSRVKREVKRWCSKQDLGTITWHVGWSTLGVWIQFRWRGFNWTGKTTLSIAQVNQAVDLPGLVAAHCANLRVQNWKGTKEDIEWRGSPVKEFA